MNLTEERSGLIKKAQSILAKGSEITEEDLELVRGYKSSIQKLTDRINAASDFSAFAKSLDQVDEAPAKQKATSLGDHFFKSVGAQFRAQKSLSNAQVSAPEYDVKANTDTAIRPATISELSTDFVREFVPATRRRLTVRDLLGQFNLSGSSVSYWEEPGIEGDFTTVAEGGAKPQLHPIDPVKHNETLTKIAGFWTTTDEMLEDEEYLVSAINNLLTYKLDLFEENQLLNGDGAGSNIKGILNRNNVQVLAQGSDTLADAIFKAITNVSTVSGYTADAVVMNPADWQTLRLAKDTNGQYYGGGMFYGPYGNDMVQIEPSPWGVTPVITPAIAKGTALVGAFQLGAQTASKGGLRVEFTNSHANDFTENKVTFRLEKRELLMVPSPKSFVKVTLAA